VAFQRFLPGKGFFTLDRFFFTGANARIAAIGFGNPEAPPLVMIHGMRDHGLGFRELIDQLAQHFYVLAADLRGHGHSDKTGTYTMVQLVADVAALFAFKQLDQAILVGHSLGGHVAQRFAATFPELVSQLVLLDGMGPPGIDTTPENLNARFREGVKTVLAITGERRQIPDESDAMGRLRANNPKMSESLAKLVVREGTEPHPDGGIRWRWESAVNMIWQTFSQAETESLLPAITCPVLLLTGEDGLSYWTAMRPQLDDPAFYQQELERRVSLFPDARHVVIAGAGHMLHYDQPKLVLEVLSEFLALAPANPTPPSSV
jgi:pimeloyl-ACP methyl ester carboxylesterase